jgi:hypothetical protein
LPSSSRGGGKVFNKRAYGGQFRYTLNQVYQSEKRSELKKKKALLVGDISTGNPIKINQNK